MREFDKVAERVFFRNPKRSYREQIDQLEWSKKCVDITNQFVSYVKGMDINTLSDKELFDELIIKSLGNARKELAAHFNQKEVGFGNIRDFHDITLDTNFDWRLTQFDATTVRSNIKQLITKNVKAAQSLDSCECSIEDTKYNNFVAESVFHGGKFKVESKYYDDGEEAIPGIKIHYAKDYDMDKFKEYVGSLLRKALKADPKDKEELYDTVAKFRWNMVISNCFTRGTSAITDIAEAALFKYHGYNVYPRKGDEISRDIKTFFYPNEHSYSRDYENSFLERYKPSLQI